MASGRKGLAEWLGPEWSSWLTKLPALWDARGDPAIPWLPPLAGVKEIRVEFCANLHVIGERGGADQALQAVAECSLAENQAIKNRLGSPLIVSARLRSTTEVVFELIRLVCARIEDGYGKRFGDPFKDLIREMHRYLTPDLGHIPYDEQGARLGTRKGGFAKDIRKNVALALLKAFGVEAEEVRGWLMA